MGSAGRKFWVGPVGRALCAMLGPEGVRNKLWAAAEQAFRQSAAKTLPTLTVEARRPWISAATLGLVQCRNRARTAKDLEAEADYNKRIRSSARADRRKWLEDLAATGDWTRIRKLRTKPKPQQGRLQDAAGNIVSSEHKGETMAEYLERAQWAVRPVTAHRFEEHLGEELPVNYCRRAAKRFKNSRACGLDNVPAELEGTLLYSGTGGDMGNGILEVVFSFRFRSRSRSRRSRSRRRGFIARARNAGRRASRRIPGASAVEAFSHCGCKRRGRGFQ